MGKKLLAASNVGSSAPVTAKYWIPRSLDTGMPHFSVGITTCLAITSHSVLAVFQTKQPLPVPVFAVTDMMLNTEETDDGGWFLIAADK